MASSHPQPSVKTGVVSINVPENFILMFTRTRTLYFIALHVLCMLRTFDHEYDLPWTIPEDKTTILQRLFPFEHSKVQILQLQATRVSDPTNE
jgi:hypothetical protein